MDLSSRKKQLTRIAVAVAVVCAGIISYLGYRVQQGTALNAAFEQNSVAEVAHFSGAYGRFARALDLQRRGAYQDAVKVYAALAKERDQLGTIARYNTATLYLQWAINAADDEAAHLSVPLLEMAKETYRQLLRHDEQFWPARYNLERVLQLQPDQDEFEPDAYFMPEHSPQALGIIESSRELP